MFLFSLILHEIYINFTLFLIEITIGNNCFIQFFSKFNELIVEVNLNHNSKIPNKLTHMRKKGMVEGENN